jgi:hypothetical protein
MDGIMNDWTLSKLSQMKELTSFEETPVYMYAAP